MKRIHCSNDWVIFGLEHRQRKMRGSKKDQYSKTNLLATISSNGSILKYATDTIRTD